LSPPGGGNAVAAWMVHALAGRHDVATLTEGRWSAADTNAFYGTSIGELTVKPHVMPFPWRLLSALHEDRLTRLRMCAVLRQARRLASQYDLLITADNYAAFAKPGIQYVHFPARLEPELARFAPIVHPYFWLCDWILGAKWITAAGNVTLANSRWTADGIERLGEVSTPIVLYPPVVDPGPNRPWAERDDTFLCVGRFHGSKRIELAISIVRAVRAQSIPRARLVIVGSPVDAAYTLQLRRLSAGERWIEYRENLSRPELNGLMGRSRYGIQAMENEHFGMATAELTRAGCLVFAHRSGGTPEVLNQEDALLWSTEEDAVRRISAISGSSSPSTDSLRARLRNNAQSFSTERFVERFTGVVDGVR
jgi:glycosyltransferase involved in cell wall biosynthesis